MTFFDFQVTFFALPFGLRASIITPSFFASATVISFTTCSVSFVATFFASALASLSAYLLARASISMPVKISTNESATSLSLLRIVAFLSIVAFVMIVCQHGLYEAKSSSSARWLGELAIGMYC